MNRAYNFTRNIAVILFHSVKWVIGIDKASINTRKLMRELDEQKKINRELQRVEDLAYVRNAEHQGILWYHDWKSGIPENELTLFKELCARKYFSDEAENIDFVAIASLKFHELKTEYENNEKGKN